MQFLKLYSALSYSLKNASSSPSRSFLSFFSTVSSPSQPSKLHISINDYFQSNFKFSKARSIYVSQRVFGARLPQQPLIVLNFFFKQARFSAAHIQSIICGKPCILFCDVDKMLMPRFEYFKLVGFEGSELGKFVSTNPDILTSSLTRSLVPSLETIRNIAFDEVDFAEVLHKNCSLFTNPQIILRNASFFESCGIAGYNLSLLLRRQPWLFTAKKSQLQDLVSRAVNMGFHVNSTMLVHALQTMSRLSMETFERKLELLQSCGFSKDETLQMFRTDPSVLDISERKLKFRVQVFLDTIMLPKSVLVHNPTFFTRTMKGWVIPRYKVVQLLVLKKVLKTNPDFVEVFDSPVDLFLDKYVFNSEFRDHSDDILGAYNAVYSEYAFPK